MNKPVFDHAKENIVAGIGVADNRASEISKYMRMRLAEFNQQKIKKLTMVVEMAIDEKMIVNESELLYVGFIIGMFIEHRHHENETVEMVTEGLTEALKKVGKGEARVEIVRQVKPKEKIIN